MKEVLIALAFHVACFAQTRATDQPPHSVKLSWPQSISKGVKYHLYRAAGECGASGQVFERLTPSAISALTYTDANVRSGRKYCYRVTSTDGKSESPPSRQINVVVP